MPIPTAVSPSQLTPGLYLVIDLLAGASSPGTGTLRTAIIAPKSASGDLTVDTEVRAGAGEESAGTAFGIGTVGHLCAKRLYEKYPSAQVDFIAPTAGAGTATLNVTLAGAPASNQTILWDIMGREFEVAWLVGETPDDVRDKCIDAINQRTDDLAVTAVSGGVGIVTINGKVTGNVSNDILVQAIFRDAQTGSETITGAATLTPLAGGTTDPDLTTALSNLEGREYHFIVPCLSNTDVANTGALNNHGRVVDHIENLDSGKDAKLQQVITGFTGTLAQAIAAAPNANAGQNFTAGQILLCIAGRSLPGEFGGREAGGRLAAESIDPAANRIGELLDNVVGAKDKIADKPTLPESESALGNGVSLVDYTAQGLEVLSRAVTTHSQSSTGAADRRLLDVQNVSATYIVARDMRTALPEEFPQAKITADTPEGEEPPPEGVIEERDIKGFIISRLRFWQRKAVITKASLDAAIASGELIVQVNESDATQVDIVMPFKIVQPLAKFGVVAQRQPS